ncbi:MAG: hypothetical protein ABSE39_00775 [Candidatus Bathyarchaeia archaeon]
MKEAHLTNGMLTSIASLILIGSKVSYDQAGGQVASETYLPSSRVKI